MWLRQELQRQVLAHFCLPPASSLSRSILLKQKNAFIWFYGLVIHNVTGIFHKREKTFVQSIRAYEDGEMSN